MVIAKGGSFEKMLFMKALLAACLAVVMTQSTFAQHHSDIRERLAVSERIRKAFGIGFDPASATLSEFLELESRLSAAARIQANHGISFDYRTTTLRAMLDAESRLEACKRLMRLGLALDYRQYSIRQFLDFESRINSAARLKSNYAIAVDWRDYSARQLLDAEAQLSRSQVATASTSRFPTASNPAFDHPTQQRASSDTPQLASSHSEYQYPATIPSTAAPLQAPITHYSTRTDTPTVAGSSNYVSRYYDPTYRPAVGDHYVQGHLRSDGTYVPGHYRTDADDSFWNNYSSSGNLNPYNGRIGYKLPPISSSYGRISGYGGSSYVRGYTRRNGTYVSGHYRRK